MDLKKFTQLVIEIHKGAIGKGPSAVRVLELDNVLVLDIKGSLTTIEASLAKIAEENKVLIRKTRRIILEHILEQYGSKLWQGLAKPDLLLEDYTFALDYLNDRTIIVLIFNMPLGIAD